MIFQFFIVAAFIFITFRLLNLVNDRIKLHLIRKYNLHYLFPVLESFSWMLFILWVAKVIYDSHSYFALISFSIVFILIAGPLFILTRDFLSGIILKIQNKIAVGMYIEIEEIKGMINKASHLNMDIEDKHGNITSISYHYVYGKKMSRLGNNLNLEKITLKFDFPESVKVNELISLLKKEVMNTPWVVISQSPIIESTKVENGRLMVEVGAFVLDKSYAENIKTSVMSHFRSVLT